MIKHSPKAGELIAAAAGLLLAISVFLTWYTTAPESQAHHANINGHQGSLSAWQVHPILRILLLLGAAAPLILLWIVIRGHELSWPRGEMTAVVAITALTLVFYVGIIDRPGEPQSSISIDYGWFLALIATIGMLVGAAWRSSESEPTRKPPGVL
jgi:hypothetical protein